MRRLTCLCLAAALCGLALPALAEQAPEPQAVPAVEATQAELPIDLMESDAATAECGAPQAAVDAEEPIFLAGEQCGGVICGKGTYCCNPTCNNCVPFGMSCTQESCN